MLSALVRFSIARRGIVVAGAIALVLYGVLKLRSTGLDIFPGVRAETRRRPDGSAGALDGAGRDAGHPATGGGARWHDRARSPAFGVDSRPVDHHPGVRRDQRHLSQPQPGQRAPRERRPAPAGRRRSAGDGAAGLLVGDRAHAGPRRGRRPAAPARPDRADGRAAAAERPRRRGRQRLRRRGAGARDRAEAGRDGAPRRDACRSRRRRARSHRQPAAGRRGECEPADRHHRRAGGAGARRARGSGHALRRCRKPDAR